MTIPTIKSTSLNPEQFFGKLFQIRDQIHLRHLRVLGVGSYAQHKALNEFYDGILDLTDGLIESYQGKYGIVNITIKESKDTDAITLLKELVSLTDNGSVYKMFKETWLQNELDEISKLTYQTLYKLQNLK
jgi:hypothetical protein